MDTRLLWVRRLAVISVAMTFLLMLLGAWVKANGAGLACPDWPGCYGSFFPPFPSVENGGAYDGHPVVFTQAQELYEWAHRAVVALIIVPVAALAIAAGFDRRFTKELRALPALAVGIYFLQALLGALTVVTGNPPWATTLHLATAVLWFFTLTVAASFAFLKPLRAAVLRPAHAPAPQPESRRVHFVYPEAAPDDEAANG
ncbi:MAG TPA: COX15/CtaA family protein [Candidatus Thermoplasmatota archaeon]|nr:COX15/CtaA family protein [Candidatus Thermoplasmatota archaeon]